MPFSGTSGWTILLTYAIKLALVIECPKVIRLRDLDQHHKYIVVNFDQLSKA
jgi:hypothetical protein